jgi:hypothetical protein
MFPHTPSLPHDPDDGKTETHKRVVLEAVEAKGATPRMSPTSLSGNTIWAARANGAPVPRVPKGRDRAPDLRSRLEANAP